MRDLNLLSLKWVALFTAKGNKAEFHTIKDSWQLHKRIWKENPLMLQMDVEVLVLHQKLGLIAQFLVPEVLDMTTTTLEVRKDIKAWRPLSLQLHLRKNIYVPNVRSKRRCWFVRKRWDQTMEVHLVLSKNRVEMIVLPPRGSKCVHRRNGNHHEEIKTTRKKWKPPPGGNLLSSRCMEKCHISF